MRSRLAAAVAIVLLILFAVPAAASVIESDHCSTRSHGRLISTADLLRLEAAQVAEEIRSPARFGVTAVRVIYCTVSTDRRPTVASGLLALPLGVAGRLPLVSYEHGTTVGRGEAPSFLSPLEGRIIPFFFASDGFAVAAPDYLGLGVSTLRHPYGDAATEASASLDLLAAAATVAARRGIGLSRDILITGFSQGGQATMALGQALRTEQTGRTGWRTRALAPIAGPFDLRRGIPAALDPATVDPAKATVYLAYLLTAWKSLHHLYDDPRDVFRPPYASVVEGLFDGSHGSAEVLAALPSAPTELFGPRTLAWLARTTGRLAAALRENETCHWAPAAPTRLYAGRGDRDVPFSHATVCREQIMARGGRADVVDVGDVDHLGTGFAALPLVRAWFRELVD